MKLLMARRSPRLRIALVGRISERGDRREPGRFYSTHEELECDPADILGDDAMAACPGASSGRGALMVPRDLLGVEELGRVGGRRQLSRGSAD